jgi:hypothetical protein
VRHYYRPAREGAELIPPERVLLLPRRAGRHAEIQKVVLGIELVVAEKFIERAVKVIGAGLERNLHQSAVCLPVLSRIAPGLHLELLNGVH